MVIILVLLTFVILILITLATIVQGNRRIDLASPIDGVINLINEEVLSDPEILRKDPYKTGWLLEVRPANILENIQKLKIASEASTWIERELKRFAEFLALYIRGPQELGVTIQDGGEYIPRIVEKMDDHQFIAFTKRFFG
ncbi:MAG: hypothetical protein AB1756_00215 [Acidobacteriota bacterium]